MKNPSAVLLPVLAACAAFLTACGPAKPEPTRIISARQLLTAEDCKAYFSAAFERSGESFMGHNPPTLERDHVSNLDYSGEHGEQVSLSLDQSVSVAESARRAKEYRAAYEMEPKFREVPGFGDSGAWESGNGHRINFSRPPYRVAVQVIVFGGADEDAKSDAAMRHFAKIVDERLKQLAAPPAGK